MQMFYLIPTERMNYLKISNICNYSKEQKIDRVNRANCNYMIKYFHNFLGVNRSFDACSLYSASVFIFHSSVVPVPSTFSATASAVSMLWSWLFHRCIPFRPIVKRVEYCSR